ncbi:chemotaxis protein methyltransferase CheR [Alicyclobacillus sacchari]|uniref:protein-glutamate O-methyltransferase n=1 Tax=Alicyclobacillus sacchari TaxID=392010 RepID=A0A4R8LSU3_9BACL|nr:protein-glutamate O-methyltransferase CheR [Alicyclobacillus sacchari]TDY50740.1 chemotaxis protein methyltransferase CheR [Alicyclobacillus sacchari]GMA55732.1 chemotaxis protein methyltransferase [Alicyclobacillus sacchari]
MDEFEWFVSSFRELTGIDLSHYKRPQMERRLTSLRDRRGYSDFPSYVRAMREKPELLDELLDRMTINVSEFFRNPDRWKDLRAIVQDMGQPIQAWSAACSTGEEPYSLAILLAEMNVRSSILATDIDLRVLDKARRGEYGHAQLREVDDRLRSRYFYQQDGNYRVSDEIREAVQFRQHNLLSDPYPADLDLIICRNVLIYFTEDTKQLLVRRFAAALRPGGVLFVGSTEQLLGLSLSGLEPLRPFMYVKKNHAV